MGLEVRRRRQSIMCASICAGIQVVWIYDRINEDTTTHLQALHLKQDTVAAQQRINIELKSRHDRHLLFHCWPPQIKR
jgi:hypothetical protein